MEANTSTVEGERKYAGRKSAILNMASFVKCNRLKNNNKPSLTYKAEAHTRQGIQKPSPTCRVEALKRDGIQKLKHGRGRTILADAGALTLHRRNVPVAAELEMSSKGALRSSYSETYS